MVSNASLNINFTVMNFTRAAGQRADFVVLYTFADQYSVKTASNVYGPNQIPVKVSINPGNYGQPSQTGRSFTYQITVNNTGNNGVVEVVIRQPSCLALDTVNAQKLVGTGLIAGIQANPVDGSEVQVRLSTFTGFTTINIPFV